MLLLHPLCHCASDLTNNKPLRTTAPPTVLQCLRPHWFMPSLESSVKTVLTGQTAWSCRSHQTPRISPWWTAWPAPVSLPLRPGRRPMASGHSSAPRTSPAAAQSSWYATPRCSSWLPPASTIQCTVKVNSSYKNYRQHPVLKRAHSILYLLPWQTCSFKHNLTFSGKHSAILQIELFVNKQPLLSVAMYSLIALNELLQNWQNYSTMFHIHNI